MQSLGLSDVHDSGSPPAPQVRLWWTRPPGWPTHLVSGALFLWLSWYSLFPIVWAAILPFVLSLLWLGAWGVRLFLRITAPPNAAPPMSLKAGLRWSSVPILVIAALALMSSGLGVRIGFEMCRPEMNRVMQQAMASPDRPPQVRRVGPYRIRQVTCERTPNSYEWRCRIALQDANNGNGGFYYTTRLPHERWFPKETDLGGDWYAWASWPM